MPGLEQVLFSSDLWDLLHVVINRIGSLIDLVCKERVYLVYNLLRKSGQEFKAETMEKRCLLSFSLWLAQFAFLYPLGPLAQGWYHPGLDPQSMEDMPAQTYL